jgi:hypothetical protein
MLGHAEFSIFEDKVMAISLCMGKSGLWENRKLGLTES